MLVIRLWADADDLILLAPTVTALKKIINICELYAVEYDIKFNGSKSKYVLYVGRECAVFHIDIFVNGDTFEQVAQGNHLHLKLSTVNKYS